MIIPSDIQFRLSSPAGNLLAQSDPNQSLGKFVSSTEWTGGDLFDDVSDTENFNGHTDYRCLFICNLHATDTLFNALVWRSGKDADGSQIFIAIDTDHPASLITASAAHDPGSEIAQPGTLDFFTAPSKLGALPLGNLPPQFCRAIWIKRVTFKVPAKPSDGFFLNVDGASPL